MYEYVYDSASPCACTRRACVCFHVSRLAEIDVASNDGTCTCTRDTSDAKNFG